MKKNILILFLSICFISAKAQIQADPAHWAYGLKKLAGNIYEVHLQATIDPPWHIYAQKQGKDFIGTATKITFAKQAGLILIGQPVEHGKKDIFVNKEVQITNYEYGGKVDFVQKVSLKSGVQEIKGTIIYQTCTHERCLTATSVDFSIPINN